MDNRVIHCNLITAHCYMNIFENVDMTLKRKSGKEINDEVNEFIKELNE